MAYFWILLSKMRWDYMIIETALVFGRESPSNTMNLNRHPGHIFVVRDKTEDDHWFLGVVSTSWSSNTCQLQQLEWTERKRMLPPQWNPYCLQKLYLRGFNWSERGIYEEIDRLTQNKNPYIKEMTSNLSKQESMYSTGCIILF